MSLYATNTMPPPNGGGGNDIPATEQAEHGKTASSPTTIAMIKPQQNDLLGKNPEKFALVVRSRNGKTLRETKWDSARGGWPVSIVQIRGLDTENLVIGLRELRFPGFLSRIIASGPLTMKAVESAIHASHDRLEIPIIILSRGGLRVTDRKFVLVVEIRVPSFLPVWITSISLAEPAGGLTDQILRKLDIVFKSRQGKRLKKSAWNSAHRCWDVNLPQLPGEATEHLSIELRIRRSTGLYKTLATMALSLEESEAAKESGEEIRKVFVIPPSNRLIVQELFLAIRIGTLDVPPSDTDRVALPRSVTQIMDNTSVITKVLAPLSKILQHKREVDEKLAELVDCMNQLYGCAVVQDNPLRNYEAFRLLFDTMIQQTIECFLFISNYISDGYLRHMLNAPQKIDEFTKAFRKLKDHFSDAQTYRTTITALEAKELLVDLRESFHHFERKFDLRNSKSVLQKELNTNAFQLPSEQPRCLLGTRQHTLCKILSWISTGEESLLWLSGIAGSGKSSIMATLHDYLAQIGHNGRLAAYVRFHRTSFSCPSDFVKALAYRLASFDKRLAIAIAKVLDEQPVILQQSLVDQLRLLVTQPIEDLKAAMKVEGQIVVLVDGLDECMEEAGGSDTFSELLAVFSQLASRRTFERFPFLRFIIASRPEEPIHATFTQPLQPDNDPDRPIIHHLRLDTSSPETTADIVKYLTVKLEEIFRKNDKFRELCKQENAVPRLAESSHGLFIWANVVVRFLRLAQNRERLQLALDITIPKDASALDVLNKLYSTVLHNVAAEHGDEDVKAHIRSILGLVIAVGRVKAADIALPALTEDILCGLLEHLPDKVDDNISLLPRLGSIMEGVHSPLAELILLHKSFEDYLTDECRAGDPWYIDVEGHWIPKTAECCIQMVHSNVFSDTPETSAILSFAHHYWAVAFVRQLDSNRPFPGGKLSHTFLEILQQGFLRWVRCAHNHKHPESDVSIFSLTSYGLSYTRKTIDQTPDIVGEAADIFEQHPSILGQLSLSSDLQIIFLCLCLNSEKMPTLRKYYIPQFSNLASGSRDFWTILSAIESIAPDSANLVERLKPTDSHKHDMNDLVTVLQIIGVPIAGILERMIEKLSRGGRLEQTHYQLSRNAPDEE